MSKYKEPPEQCPQLRTCNAIITEDEFDGLCDSKSWVHCERISAASISPYMRKPSDWLVDFKKKRCLECGVEKILNPNGLCDDCLKKLTAPKTKLDLQEG